MRAFAILLALAIAGIAGGAGGYRLGTGSWPDLAAFHHGKAESKAATATVLYWRHPDGKDEFSPQPAKTADGRDFIPVYDGDEPPLSANAEASTANGQRRILYYRNPMGLPDTSPTPKKDWMGMDYIPVYEGEEQDDGTVVKVSLERVQRSGVRTEIVERRSLARPIRVPGTVRIDERRIKVVTLRADGFIEDLFVNTTGQAVRAGEPLFRVYSPQIQQAQTDLLVALRDQRERNAGGDRDRLLDGAMRRLLNLGVPERRIREIQATGANPRTLDWPAPMTGVVIEKRIVDGQRALAGDELYRIVDLSTLWVIANVPEQDIGHARIGDPASVALIAYPGESWQGQVTYIYPDLMPEARTARLRIELPNPDGRLKPDMYADVVIRSAANEAPVIAVPDSAIIDSGARQIVLVAQGEGRFEPRPVKTGRRGEGYVEVGEGISVGEAVVTTATFLIDAESNLRAALKAFTAPEGAK